MPDLTPLEAAEITPGRAAFSAELLSEMQLNTPVDDDVTALQDGIDALQKIAAGEYKLVVHGHIVTKHRHTGGYVYGKCPECNAEIETQHPVEGDEPYCSECGAQLAESFQGFCPRCGARLDGEDGAPNA